MKIGALKDKETQMRKKERRKERGRERGRERERERERGGGEGGGRKGGKIDIDFIVFQGTTGLFCMSYLNASFLLSSLTRHRVCSPLVNREVQSIYDGDTFDK